MENENIKGHWAGVFSYSGGQTTIDFTEDVTAKKFFMKPFVKSYSVAFECEIGNGVK